MTGAAVIEVQHLGRRFADVDAVRDLSFAIERGQVLGFIGANGAGKTTTMRIMATLDLPSAGTVRVCGHDVVDSPREVRQRIGWMPDSYGAYANTSVYEYLDFFARSFGLRGKERSTAVYDVMEFTDLVSLSERPVDKLSKGMGQRLCLGRALLHDPDVLLLDEPAAGLDPKKRVEFKRLVRLLADDGKTIFISSHILSELEEMCDSMLFIDEGRIVHHGSAESLKTDTATGVVFQIVVAGPPEGLEEWTLMNPGVELLEATRDGARVRLDTAAPDSVADVLKRLVRDGLQVVEFKREARRLEQAFIETLERNGGHDA